MKYGKIMQTTRRNSNFLCFQNNGSVTVFPSVEVLGYNVLIEPDEVETHSKGGILLPDQERAKRKVLKGKVVGVGPGKVLESGDVANVMCKVGDRVAFRRNIPIEEIDIVGKMYFLINADGVVLRFTNQGNAEKSQN